MRHIVSRVNGPKGSLLLLQLILSQNGTLFSLPPFSSSPSPHFPCSSAKPLIYCVSSHCDDERYCEKLLKISSENSKMRYFPYFPMTAVHDLSHFGLGKVSLKLMGGFLLTRVVFGSDLGSFGT